MPSDIRNKGDVPPSTISSSKPVRAYRFSTVIILFFLLVMTAISSLIVVTSYMGARDVVQHSINQLSDRIRIIANLSFNEFLLSIQDVDELIVNSNALLSAIETSDVRQQQKILEGVYNAHQEGHLDFLMLQTVEDKNVIDVSTTVYDLDILKKKAMSVPQSNFNNLLVIAEGSGSVIYTVINKTVLLSEDMGKALGYVYTGIILNDNIEVLARVMENTDAVALELKYNGHVVSGLNFMKEIAGMDASGSEDAGHLIILTILDLAVPTNEKLFLKITYPQSAIRRLEKNYLQATYRISAIVIIITILSMGFMRVMTRYATSSLTSYAKEIAKDKSTAKFQGTRIREFNEVGLTLSHLIREMSEVEESIIQSNRELERLARVASAAKNKLKKSNVELAEANEELEEFAYRTSHDLRSPLVSSIALLDTAKNAIAEKDEVLTEKSLNMIHDSLVKLEMLIRDILILNEVKNREEEYKTINVEEIIDESIKAISNMDNFDKMEIRKVFDGPGTLKTKKIKFRMIVDNLISNAVKYYDPEKKSPYIEISTREKDGRFVLCVKDNGLGIPVNKREKLFTMFSRFHPKVSFGSGLGLYLIKKGAHAMGGDIRYRAHKEGSIFEFEVPIADDKV